ncbi:MAG: FG-GAP-like repeat-containing protein, partial [Verrucomicrobiota bacterium]
MTSNSLSYFARIEPLESRIAPALLVNGANLLGGAGNPDTGETSIAGNEATLVKVTSGQAIVWYNNGAVTGISFGPNTAIEILGNVGEYVSPSEYFFGSIVGNLTAEGRLSDSNNDPSDGEDGNVLLPNNLTSLKTFPLSGDNGDFGAIITGGAVSNVNVHGKVTVGIYAGDSVFREDSQVEGTSLFKSVSLGEVGPILDPNPLDLASTTGFTFSRAASTNLTAGASVSNVDVQTAENMQIFAGSGGLTASLSKGASGGNISNVTIHSAFSQVNLESYVLRAGDGQNGVAGGAGGSITGVIEETSSGKILIVSGQGGNGTGGPGGAGGSISLLDMQSDSSAYKVVTGNGGNGVGGGAGGAVVNTNFANNKATNSLIITRDFTKDGVDDVLVVDSNTGDLILSENTGDGANFTQVLQYMDGITPVYRIAGLGTTPVGAVAVDYDNDDDLDIVVAYKNSINLGVFTNTGEGGFWNFKTNAVNGFSVGLGFSPALLSLDKVGGTGLAVIGDDPGQSVLHHLISDGKTYIPHATGTKLGQFAVALTPVISTAGENLVYVATESGLLIPFAANSNPKEPAYTSLGAQFRLNSDILNLDVDTEGHRILVSQTGAKGISLFEVGPHGALAELAVPVLNPGGRPLLAKFVDDQTPMADSIAVLTALSAGSRIDLFDAREADEDPATEDAAFVLTNSLSTQPSLRNFGFAFDGSTFGVASVAGSLSQFFFSPSLSGLDSYVLPFTGKTVDMRTGDGGNAFDSGKVLGKGGSGGSISSFNADAIAIRLQAGDGGDSVNGAAGAGGSASNPSTFRSKSAQTITPRLVADESLIVLVGQGGTSSGEGVRAWGGDGGSINGMTLSLGAGEVVLSGGHGGASGRGGSLAGDGGNITGVKALSLGGDLLLKTGNGGDALPATNPVTKSNAKAGNGGTLSNFSFQLELTDMEEREIPYFVSITTGKGGSALGGTGGAGGTLSN